MDTVYWRATESLNSPGVNWDTIWKEIALSSEILAAHPSISMLFWAGYFESLRGTPKSFNFASLDFSELCNSEASESLSESMPRFRGSQKFCIRLLFRFPKNWKTGNFSLRNTGSHYFRGIQRSVSYFRAHEEIVKEGATLNTFYYIIEYRHWAFTRWEVLVHSGDDLQNLAQ